MQPQAINASNALEPVPLNALEIGYWSLDEALAGALRTVIPLRIDGLIEGGLLQAAIRHLQERHPKLRAAVVPYPDGSLRYDFARAPALPFEIKDYDQPELPWREETRRLMERGFPREGPLAAITVLRCPSQRYSELLLLVHHAMADALAGMMLLDDLLTEYGRLEERLPAPPRPVLRPLTDVRVTSTGGLMDKLWTIRRFIDAKRRNGRQDGTALPHAEGAEHSQWAHWVFDRDETLRFVQRCRKEKSSVSGATIAAVFCGLMDCLPASSDRRGQGYFKCMIPVNARDVLEGPSGAVTAEDLGCFATVMHEFYRISRDTDFWEPARQTKRAMDDFVRRRGHAFRFRRVLNGSKKSGESSPWVPQSGAGQSKLNASGRFTLLANYFGVINMAAQYGSLRPQACTLTYRNRPDGSSLGLQALIMNQRLNVGFAATDTLEPEFWERLQSAVHGRLRAACEVA